MCLKESHNALFNVNEEKLDIAFRLAFLSGVNRIRHESGASCRDVLSQILTACIYLVVKCLNSGMHLCRQRIVQKCSADAFVFNLKYPARL